MSIASILDNNKDGSFTEINCAVLNANTINATTINGGGGSGGSQNLQSVLNTGNNGGGQSIVGVNTLTTTGRIEIVNSTGTDCQIVMCPTAQGTAGLHYGVIANTSNLIVGLWNNGFANLLSLNIDGSASICSNGTLNISNGTSTSRVYDETFNQPTLSDVTRAGSSANGSNISNVGTLSCNTLTSPTITGVSTINGAVYPPPAGSTSVRSIARSNSTLASQVVPSTPIAINWQQEDESMSVGTADIVAVGAGFNSFQNNSSAVHTYSFSGYVTYTNTGTANSSIKLRATLSSGPNQTNQSTVWMANEMFFLDTPVIGFSFNVVLNPNDFVTLYTWTNSGAQIRVNGENGPFASRIIIFEY